jgi:hypothetical protein
MSSAACWPPVAASPESWVSAICSCGAGRLNRFWKASGGVPKLTDVMASARLTTLRGAPCARREARSAGVSVRKTSLASVLSVGVIEPKLPVAISVEKPPLMPPVAVSTVYLAPLVNAPPLP